ncbi:MAG TPA: ABC transporter ATP-binding protein [Vicinamibacterales bacterium]|jgi:ATP-binding cassette subfamily B multidrug efflux pump|nr:ABC transporter ATP-binding protein [Vicinamibacterales bacterium]
MSAAVRALLPYVIRYRRAFVTGFICVLLTTTFQLASPWVLKYAIDDLNLGVTREKLLLYAGLLLGISLVRGVFLFLMRRIVIGASRDIEYDMRNDFFARLERLPLGYYQARRTGDLMSRATNDLNAVRMMIGPAVMYSAQTVLVFVVAIALMVTIDLRLTLIALIPLPFVSLSVKYFGSAIHKRFEKIQAQLSDVSAVVQEALAGVRVVRAYRQEAHEQERFRRSNLEYLERNRVLIRLQGAFYPSMTFFLGLGSLMVLWLGSRAVIRGEMSLGEFVAFNGYLVMLAWPMIAFGWVTNILQRGFASWERMLEIMRQEPAISDAEVTEDGRCARMDGEVELRSLTFTYPGSERPVLRDINLRIEAGQTVAFVGGTGSGKSTILSLLPRMHQPPKGTVFIGGVDVREIPLERLRSAIGFVPQEPFLFSDTIAENVAFSAPEAGAPVELVREAASVARLDKDVETFPRGYQTAVGERGITLSGGQKQRTAIARALFGDPSILILDDALSAVDTYTEEEILSRLHAVMRQRTSIIVAHRISTVREADQIFVLDDGRIAEHGTHDQLVRRNGLYAALHRKQLLEEELQAS